MVNKVFLLGVLGKDPETRATPSGQVVCKFSLATSEKWTDAQGQKNEKTEWHAVIAWGKLAENCGQYLFKGSKAFVEGRIQYRSYDDKDGNKKWITEIVAQNVKFLGSPGDRASRPGVDGGGGESQEPPPGGDDSDIPF